jgi:uncharacterized protein YjbJ (UPF0337 family)
MAPISESSVRKKSEFIAPMFDKNDAIFLFGRAERHSLSTTETQRRSEASLVARRATRCRCSSRSVVWPDRKQGTFSAPSGSSSNRRIAINEDRVEGTVRNVGGKVQEGFGRMTGDARTRAEGIANQAAGKAQELYGQATETAQESAATLDDWLRHQIKTQPYTSALVAVGIGWLLGRMHRPL